MGSCSALHSKMIQFCSAEKYCDVNIRVQDQSFPCHRVVLASASEYFDALFGGNFLEKDAREIVLQNIDAETFTEILRCVYTAEMCEITASNVLNLLNASLFLMIHPLEVACTTYILNNVRLLQNHIIQILVLARSFNITALIDFLTQHVIQNFFSLFHNDETLLEITFKDLSFLLDRMTENKTPFKYEDLLLHFFIRWVHHASEERREYFTKLIDALDFEKISPNYVTFVMQYYDNCIDQPGLEGMPPLKLPRVMEESESTSTNLCNDTESSKKRLCLEKKLSEFFAGSGKLSAIYGDEITVPFHNPTIYKDVLGLHIYAKYISIDHGSVKRPEGVVKVLSSNKYYPWFVSHETDVWQSCRERCTIVQESTNVLYCMEILRDRHVWADSRQTFCTYTSLDLKLTSSVLTSPPVPLQERRFNMCATSENDIYLFNFLIAPRRNHVSITNDQFSVEEIDRGFYHYNCDVDKWFPAPKIETWQRSSCICANNNLIYSIGGETIESRHSGLFQAFDHHSGRWMILPDCPSLFHNHYASNSCFLQNKVFVSNRTCVQAYDTIAGRWESISGPFKYDWCHKMVPYDNRLWLLCEFSNTYQDHSYSCLTYSPNTQEWDHCEEFNDILIRNQPNRSEGIIKDNCRVVIEDMIIFKTCSP